MNISIEKNNWGHYEIGLFYLSEEDKTKIKDKIGMSRFDHLGYYFKSGDEWTNRVSGMCFNICNSHYYPKLKILLNNLLNIYLRKEKLLKISDIEKIKISNV